MVDVCFYFQVHQPYRLRRYSIFDIGKSAAYFDERKNREVLLKVAEKCYFPTNKLMLKLLNKHKGFKLAFSLSGVVMEQFEAYEPKLIDSFEQLVDTGKVELLDETYYHSLSWLKSREEFEEQIRLHNKKIRKLFHYKPRVFRNTELIYNNELASFVEGMGYKAILAEGADSVLGWRSPNFLYRPKGTKIALLLKNYRLSDDIAFRFSEKGWQEWPLTANKFAHWISKTEGHTVNLFMDYETFGEHQWKDTGIFEFVEHLPLELQKRGINFTTPSELIKNNKPIAELDIPRLISWADIERDLSAWTGNKMQQAAIEKIYKLREAVLKSNNPLLIDAWRKLQISDHFYYMCTKWFADGDVHKYFNPYDSPYDAFIYYMNAVQDLTFRTQNELKGGEIDGKTFSRDGKEIP